MQEVRRTAPTRIRGITRAGNLHRLVSGLARRTGRRRARISAPPGTPAHPTPAVL